MGVPSLLPKARWIRAGCDARHSHLHCCNPHVGVGGVPVAVRARLVRHHILHAEGLLQDGAVEHLALQTAAQPQQQRRGMSCFRYKRDIFVLIYLLFAQQPGLHCKMSAIDSMIALSLPSMPGCWC